MKTIIDKNSGIGGTLQLQAEGYAEHLQIEEIAKRCEALELRLHRWYDEDTGKKGITLFLQNNK